MLVPEIVESVRDNLNIPALRKRVRVNNEIQAAPLRENNIRKISKNHG